MKNRPLISMVVRPSSVVIGENSALRRIAPRPEELRQDDYDEKFDDKTLFYDVFHSVEGITLSGPPLLNLKSLVDSAPVLVDGRETSECSFEDIDRTQRSYVRARPEARTFALSLPELEASVRIGRNYCEAFAGRKVLFTKSKNNNLVWLEDWTRFHAVEHGVDAVLVYDNGSTEYAAEEVLRVISGVKGIAVAVVVSWPFPFGPQGGSWGGVRGAPWDSDFCEYGIMENARRRFLSQATGVINADVDELVIAENGASVFSHLEASGADAILYAGRWIETAGCPSKSVPSFSDFRYYQPQRASTTLKWTASPAKIRGATQWKTHYIHGVRMKKTEGVVHRHFAGITSNWKRKSELGVQVDPRKHQVDRRLVQAMDNVFGSRPDWLRSVSSLRRKLHSTASR
ncbi:hypothetical protein QFZ65_001700 [Arthrobacter sp. B3I9]|nr:hypothetical protein [Arthrobacter sp. B3I9]